MTSPLAKVVTPYPLYQTTLGEKMVLKVTKQMGLEIADVFGHAQAMVFKPCPNVILNLFFNLESVARFHVSVEVM